MSFDAHLDFAYSTVATAPSPAGSGLSLVVAAGEGARFPNPATDGPFNIVVWATGQQPIWASGGNTGGNFEVCRVTARSSDTLTITRAQDGSTARTIVVGDQVALADMAKLWTDIEAKTKQRIVQAPMDPFQANIANSKYNAFGFTVQFSDQTLMTIYREGSTHLAGGVIKMVKSTDLAGSWTASPVTIASDGSYDLRNGGGGILDNDRVVVFYARYNSGTAAFVDFGYIFSDDQGATWSTYTTISVGTRTTFSPYGSVAKAGSNKWAQTWYGDDGTTFSSFVIFTTDNGSTWGNQATIGSSSSTHYSETSVVSDGNQKMVALARTDNGTTFSQFKSVDGGATWTSQSTVSFDTWSTPSPPTLSTFYDSVGNYWVACYWVNRTDTKLRVCYAPFDSLIANGSSAWGTKIDITPSVTPSVDDGYVAIVQGNLGMYQWAFGWFYHQTSGSVANIIFFLTGQVGGGNPVQMATYQAKGDVVAGTGLYAASRVAVGSNTQVLTADSTQTAGVKWAAAPVSSVFSRTGAVVAANADYYGVVAAALTGATQSARFVGATTSGAPASGTFAVGDFVIAQDGHIFICTVAGTPGTWVTISSASGSNWSVLTDGNVSSPALVFAGGDVIMVQS